MAIKVPNLEMILSHKEIELLDLKKPKMVEEENLQVVEAQLKQVVTGKKKRGKRKKKGNADELEGVEREEKELREEEEWEGEEEEGGEGEDTDLSEQEENIRNAYMERYQNALDELRMLRELNHPNICLLMGTCFVRQEEKKKLLLIYELMEGDLNSTIKHLPPPPFYRRIKICEQIATALAFVASKGIIHGDLKPTNILHLSHSLFKVTDFGLATWETRNDFEGGAPIWRFSFFFPFFSPAFSYLSI